MLTASQEADGPRHTSPLGICNTPDPNVRALSLTPTQQRSPSQKQCMAGWGRPRGGAVRGGGDVAHTLDPDLDNWTEG